MLLACFDWPPNTRRLLLASLLLGRLLPPTSILLAVYNWPPTTGVFLGLLCTRFGIWLRSGADLALVHGRSGTDPSRWPIRGQSGWIWGRPAVDPGPIRRRWGLLWSQTSPRAPGAQLGGGGRRLPGREPQPPAPRARGRHAGCAEQPPLEHLRHERGGPRRGTPCAQRGAVGWGVGSRRGAAQAPPVHRKSRRPADASM